MIILVYELDEEDIAIINNRFIGLFNTIQISEDYNYEFRMIGDYMINLTNNDIKIQTIELKTFNIKEFLEVENKKEYLKEKYMEYFI